MIHKESRDIPSQPFCDYAMGNVSFPIKAKLEILAFFVSLGITLPKWVSNFFSGPSGIYNPLSGIRIKMSSWPILANENSSLRVIIKAFLYVFSGWKLLARGRISVNSIFSFGHGNDMFEVRGELPATTGVRFAI